MGCSAVKPRDSKGITIGVSLTDAETATANLSVQTAASAGAASIDLQTDESGGTTVPAGTVLPFDSGEVAIVSTETTVSDTVTTAVPVHGVIADLTTSDVAPYFGGYTIVGGVDSVQSDTATDIADGGTLSDYFDKAFVAGMSSSTVNLGLKIIVPNAGWGILSKKANRAKTIYLMAMYPDGRYSFGCGAVNNTNDSGDVGSVMAATVNLQMSEWDRINID